MRMIQSGFLSEEDRKALTALARDASSPCRVTRRANGLVLLDAGWSYQQVANAFLLDDDCPSPDELRQFRAIRKGGSGSSGSEVKLPVVDAASVDFRLCAA